ncbi:putative short chain dehydrogenase/reductase [Nemania sp. FL0916]|nr:putative short chain dehydrogenase/reductase [Nemania sp. FL0916]
MEATKTVILVTGGNSGIGYEAVMALANASSDFHIFLGSRSKENGQEALRKIQATSGSGLKGSVSVIQIDITNQESINSARENIESQFGRLDVLINNAGMAAYQEPDMIKALRDTFEVNVVGQLMVTNTFEPLLKKSSNPYVIYVSSSQGSVTQRLDPDYEHRHVRGDTYRISKAALNMLAACHRYNFSEWNCKVLAFNPGWCITNLTGEKGREMRTKMGARDPKQPALSLVDIVLGRRDEDIAQNGMIDTDGGILPW